MGFRRRVDGDQGAGAHQVLTKQAVAAKMVVAVLISEISVLGS